MLVNNHFHKQSKEQKEKTKTNTKTLSNTGKRKLISINREKKE